MKEFEKAIAERLKKELGIEEAELTTPREQSLGDIAFPTFSLAKTLGKNPNIIAIELASRIKPFGMVKKIEANGPYLNFYIDRQKLAERTIHEIESRGDSYGRLHPRMERVMVEFFQANTHKAVHIGHVRGMCIGIALSNILEACGYQVVRANYQGDIGVHVVKCLWGLKHFEETPPKSHRLRFLGEIYTRAHQLIEGNEVLEQEIREMTKMLYDGDPELLELWRKTRQWCLEDFDKMYTDFNVKFDELFFESDVEPKGKEMVLELKERGIAEESEGAIVVNLEKSGLGVFILLRSDGVSLYSTKDLALAKTKFDQFKIDRSIYIVGSEQELYFKQLFKTLELMGFSQAEKCFHISLGLVMLPEGKMSSREGTVVLYEDLIAKLLESSLKSTKDRHPTWDHEKIRKTKTLISFSAMKFAMVSRETNRPIVFDWERALDFEGESGPYVQYAHARICSILRKNAGALPEADFSVLTNPNEERLILLLNKYPVVVTDSAEHLRPYIVAKYLLELAQSFNELYHGLPILTAEAKLKLARLHLIVSIKQVIANGLGLLGIEAPEQM